VHVLLNDVYSVMVVLLLRQHDLLLLLLPGLLLFIPLLQTVLWLHSVQGVLLASAQSSTGRQRG
jgi:hypothetical protein